MRHYQNIDLDYDQFPIPDLTLDLHWVQLPRAIHDERHKIERQAAEKARLATLPQDHKIILVPADPDVSPTELELWPLINRTVIQHLEPHPDLYHTIVEAIRDTVDSFRGWRNPFP